MTDKSRTPTIGLNDISDSDSSPQPSTSTAERGPDEQISMETILRKLDALERRQAASEGDRSRKRVRNAKKRYSSPSPNRVRTSKKRRSSPKQVRTPKRRSSSSSPTTTTTDNSTSSSDSYSDDHHKQYDRPIASFGPIVGQNVAAKLRKKILKNKFVEMSELLVRTAPNFTDEFILKLGKDSTTKFVKNKPKFDIPFPIWSEGFDIFIAVILDQAHTTSAMKNLVQSLLTYKKEITTIHKMGGDWAGFDRHFRMDRETNKCPWATIRHDLHLQYVNTKRQPFHSPGAQRQQTQQKTPGVQNIKTREGISIPHGFCVDFHSKVGQCTRGTNCFFKHKCPRCSNRHPVYRSCNQPTNTAKHEPTSTQHTFVQQQQI